MLSWDDTQQMMQDFAGDTSSDALRILKRGANVGYKIILTQLQRPVTEATKKTATRAPSSPLVSDDRVYQAPPNFLFMKSLTIKIAGTKRTLTEEPSETLWQRRTEILQTGWPERYFIRPRFGYSGATIEMDPIPDAAGNLTTDDHVFEMIYEATDKDLSVDRYSTGTISLTGGSSPSASVSGSSTTWTSKMVGRYFRNTDDGSDGMWYKITNVASNTGLTLENYYQGDTQSGVNYEICQLVALPEDIDELPGFYGVADYFAHRQKEKSELKWRALFQNGLKQARLTYGTKSRDNIVERNIAPDGGFPEATPGYFPQSGVSS